MTKPPPADRSTTPEEIAGDARVPRSGTTGTFPRATWWYAVIVAGALVVRLVFLFETEELPLVRHLIGDAAGYYEWASRIAGGAWLGTEPFYQAPLYPYTLAAFFSLFGATVTTVRLVQIVWGALAVGFLCLGAGRLFGRRVGLMAGGMLALYPPAIFFDGIVQKASLGCLLVSALVAAMAWASASRRPLAAGLVGVVAGLSVLTRENTLVWLPVLAFWLGLSCRGLGVRRVALTLGAFALGVGAVLGPVGARNVVVGGEWSVSTFQMGQNFYIGNHVGAGGLYEPVVAGHETPAFERRDAASLAERDVGRSLTAREVSNYWLDRAVRDIRANVFAWGALLGRKMLMVWNAYEVSDAESQYVYEGTSVVLAVLGRLWHFGILCPLAVVGLLVTRSRWPQLWIYHALIVTMAMSVAAFYVMARYRFPLVPLLIPFAAVGMVELCRSFRSGNLSRMRAPLAAALCVAVIVNWPIHNEKRLNAMAWMNVGVALGEAGDVRAATEFFREATHVEPNSAEARNNLAQALALQGDFAGAIPHYRAAQRIAPRLMNVAYNLGVALEQVGRSDEALDEYERALALNPSDADAQAAVRRMRAK